jgi:asparagine synthase (glutamine-hydrolysing)
MMNIQRHRGPDDQGIRLFSLARKKSVEWLCGWPEPSEVFEGALGFNRLSILDLSEQGHQPMANADGTVILAFNGEVYNAFDYTAELEKSGFVFRSRTDTEVVLYLYEKFGLDGMLSRVNGMFAIVIVDLRTGEIHIARDHFGIKPIYWTVAGSTLLFASEVKSFLTYPSFRPEIDSEHIDEYMAFRFVSGENHLLKGVKQVRPGHCLRINRNGITGRRYWQIPDAVEKLEITDAEAVNQVDHLLRASVTSQLLSDVKVGCQLSGGIDSSLVSVFAHSTSIPEMETFSVIFDDSRYSEETWISNASTAANAHSHKFTFGRSFFFDTLDKATWHLDQPIAHPNSLGIWLLARESRPFVTVLLSGEGADEIFGGYTRFYYANLRHKVSPWLPLFKAAPKLGARLERHFGGDPVDAFIGASLFQRPCELVSLRPEVDFERVMLDRRAIFAEGRADHLSNCLKYEMQTYMVDLLVRQDKMTMAHALENRVPFLDLNLVSFVRTLPTTCFVSDSIALRDTRMRGTKVVLKKLASRTFDDRFVFRPKSGFSLPLTQYFQDERFESLMEDRLLPGMARRGLVRADTVRRVWKSLPKQPASGGETLWIPVALELWAQQFIDRHTCQEQAS